MDTPTGTSETTRLRQARIARDWRQRDLAEQLGTTVVTIKRWERGTQQPSLHFRVKLCTLFGKSAQELGLMEEDPLLPATTPQMASEAVQVPLAERLSLWTIPYPRNPHFTGREDLLSHLARRLSPSRSGGPTNTRSAMLTQPEAIKGLGGIGKTQIAVEYAYRAREQDRYTHTLWINAASEEAILSSFAALAELLPSVAAQEEKDQRKLVAATILWLEQCPHPWLLIVDNADDLVLVQPYVPKQGNGSVLLTTRAHAVAALASSLEVEAMGVVEGTHLLLHRAQRLDATDEEINEASNVVMTLEGFPLAIDQAGAYIEETGCSFEDYLHLYHEHRLALLARRGMQAVPYPESVATTWSLSFEKIEQAHPASADLLRLCAYLSPDHIPEELLRKGAPHWPPVLQEAVSDLLAFNQMLEELLKFSLIKRLVEEQMLSLHRLVQVVQRERMDPQEQEHWARCVVCAVNTVFPPDPKVEIETWPQCQRYLEQVQSCDLLIQQYGLQFSEAADVLYRTAMYLHEQALYALAEPLFLRALRIWEQQLGETHPQVAYPLNYLGILYQNQGEYAEAEPLLLRAWRIWEQQLGETHPQVAYPLTNLGNLYYAQGKYAEAEPLWLRALHIREQQLGETHPQVAYPLNNLGTLYKDQGKYAEAEPLLLRALRIREQQLGEIHPLVASPLNNLGTLYWEQGKYAEAEPLLLRALSIDEATYGPEHPGVAYSLLSLGLLYHDQGKYAEAEPLLLRTLRIREQALGFGHPLVAEVLNGLANLSREQGNYEQAEPLYQRALSICEQALGPQHYQIAYPLNGLANLFRELGKYEQAEPLYSRALMLRQQHLSPQHPEIAETLQDLARLRHLQRQPTEALALYQQALSIREQAYGSEHPKTKETRRALTPLLQERTQGKEALSRETPVPERETDSLCACGCGRQIDRSKSRGAPKRFSSQACKQRFYRNAQRQKRNTSEAC